MDHYAFGLALHLFLSRVMLAPVIHIRTIGVGVPDNRVEVRPGDPGPGETSVTVYSGHLVATGFAKGAAA